MKIISLTLFLGLIYSASSFEVTDVLVDGKDLPITASCDQYLDKLLERVQLWIVKQGLDPVKTDDMEEGFSFKIGFIRYHGEIKLTNGWFQGLSTIKRKGQCKLIYAQKFLNAKVNLDVNPAMINYDYSAKLMNIGPKGGVEAKIKEMEMFIDVMVDTVTAELTLQHFEITDSGKITLKFSGNPLVDWMTNIFTRVVTDIFHGVIEFILEREVRDRLQKILEDINARGPSANPFIL